MTASAPRAAAAQAQHGRIIHLAHSPDSDDAFMFYGLATGTVDTEGLQYVHELQDIETLNQRARRAELEVTAVSIHAYAYLTDRYALLRTAQSIGDRYGRASSPVRRCLAPMSGPPYRDPGTAHHGLPRAPPLRARFHPGAHAVDQIEAAVLSGTRNSVSSSTRASSRTPTRVSISSPIWARGGLRKQACPFPSAAT